MNCPVCLSASVCLGLPRSVSVCLCPSVCRSVWCLSVLSAVCAVLSVCRSVWCLSVRPCADAAQESQGEPSRGCHRQRQGEPTRRKGRADGGRGAPNAYSSREQPGHTDSRKGNGKGSSSTVCAKAACTLFSPQQRPCSVIISVVDVGVRVIAPNFMWCRLNSRPRQW